MKCIFCQIISGEIATDYIYQDEEFVAFHDIHPQAPTHIIIIPRQHYSSLSNIGSTHEGLMGRYILLAKQLADVEGLADRGYRLVINNGPDGGQIVPHLHMHLLGGHKLPG